MKARRGTSWYLQRDEKCRFGLWVMVMVMTVCVVGCHDNVELTSRERLLDFENAGPGSLTVDVDRLVRAKVPAGPYRVDSGDVLELELPATVYPDMLTAEGAPGAAVTHTCRVSAEGMITLPDGRQVQVADRSAGEIEQLIVATYYPSLVKTRPAVYVKVLDYYTYRLQVVGAVTTPGVYQLRRDQMSLVSLLMAAGGITETGAARIRIERANGTQAKSIRKAVAHFSAAPEATAAHPSRPPRVDATPPGAPYGARPGVAVYFAPEGPLATTGWLRASKEDTVIVNRWLDIMNEPQRSGALSAAAGRMTPRTIATLNRRLGELGQFLESGADHQPRLAAFVAPAAGWQRTAGGQYVTLADVQDRAAAASQASSDIGRGEGEPETPWYAADDNADTTVVMPVRGLNIPFADVALSEGDTVVVERIEPQWISVLGLVRAPGNFPYPPEAQYRLADVLALAGGLDMIAEPRYVCVYRLRADGEVVGATFQLVNTKNQESLTRQLALNIKPGDVISVEHTPRTRKNVFMDRVLRITLGVYLDPRDYLGSDLLPDRDVTR